MLLASGTTAVREKLNGIRRCWWVCLWPYWCALLTADLVEITVDTGTVDSEVLAFFGLRDGGIGRLDTGMWPCINILHLLELHLYQELSEDVTEAWIRRLGGNTFQILCAPPSQLFPKDIN